jgi:phosphate transport system substrate-binding protein
MSTRLLKLVIVFMVAALFLSACGPKASAQTGDSTKGNITISGAFALYPMMTRWAEEFQKVNPDVTFDISAGGAGKGMTDALSNAVDIGMVSRAISPEEEAKGAYWVSVTKDAVFPVVSAQNPVIGEIMAKGIDQETFTKIFITGEIKTWGEVIGKPEITDEIHVYTRSDSCGAADAWAKFMGGKQEDLLGVGVSGDPGLLDVVIKDPLGVGYNNLGYAFDNASGDPVSGAVIAPIDGNGNGQADPDETYLTKTAAVKAIDTGAYPSPPARDLNLVTNGKPTGVTQAFIEWILIDGQQFVSEAGYIQLTPEQIEASLQKIQ